MATHVFAPPQHRAPTNVGRIFSFTLLRVFLESIRMSFNVCGLQVIYYRRRLLSLEVEILFTPSF